MFDKVNLHNEPLTIEKLRTFHGCGEYSDDEATQIIESIKELTEILFSYPYCIDNQLGVYLNQDAKLGKPGIDLNNTKPLPHEYIT
jgi:hypothetical protein